MLVKYDGAVSLDQNIVERFEKDEGQCLIQQAVWFYRFTEKEPITFSTQYQFFSSSLRWRLFWPELVSLFFCRTLRSSLPSGFDNLTFCHFNLWFQRCHLVPPLFHLFNFHISFFLLFHYYMCLSFVRLLITCFTNDQWSFLFKT